MNHTISYPVLVVWTAFVGSAAAADDSPHTSPNLHYYYPTLHSDKPETVETDLCVYGGTPGGVAAAVQMRRMGKRAVLASFDKHVGGMTSGGLSATDLGNARAIGGLAREFYDRAGRLTGVPPSAAEKLFRDMLKEAGVPVAFEQRLKSVQKDGDRIASIEMEDGTVYRARVFLDATYEGDLMALARVSYRVGREANSVYGESYNGVQFRDAHNFNYPVDPYKVEGDRTSGLLWGISPDEPGQQGDCDKKIQAYNFRMFLSDAKDRLPFPKPDGYDPERYALLLRYLLKKPDLGWKFNDGAGPFQLRNGDWNNAGGFSTDDIGRNYDWPEGDYPTREKIFQDHVVYQQGLMYFMANDERVPAVLRDKVKAFGLPKDEFVETGGWPHQLYIREGRRLVADYVMTEKNCLSKEAAEDSIGLASYNMDSHNCQRVVRKGVVRNEGDVQVGCPKPYPVSYRAIVPKEAECGNLFVPVCLSASHIAYGSIRMEPVFMILGQSAGTAAALAVDGKTSVQKVEYARLKERLLADKQVLEWTEKPKGGE